MRNNNNYNYFVVIISCILNCPRYISVGVNKNIFIHENIPVFFHLHKFLARVNTKMRKEKKCFKEMTFRSQQLFIHLFLSLSCSLSFRSIKYCWQWSPLTSPSTYIYDQITTALALSCLFTDLLAKCSELFLYSVIIPNYASPCSFHCKYIFALLPWKID